MLILVKKITRLNQGSMILMEKLGLIRARHSIFELGSGSSSARARSTSTTEAESVDYLSNLFSTSHNEFGTIS